MQPVKNITAMQELKNRLEQVLNRKEDYANNFENGVHIAVMLATELLSKERSQIVDAFNAGWKQEVINSDTYFTETFKQ